MSELEPPPARKPLEQQRTPMIVALVALVTVAAFGAGWLVGRGQGEDEAQTSQSPSPTATSSPSPTEQPTESPAAESPSTSASAEPTEDTLGNGRFFVYADSVATDTSPEVLSFDLAEFYTGNEANEIATERGDEVPVPNDVYIVNDNPLIRTVLLSPDAVVRYIPTASCCNLVGGNLDAWVESINQTAPTDYPGPTAPWWITIRGNEVVRIEQQYLP